ISFFLGLQISQSPRGIFINQSKYAIESLKKYGFKSCDLVDTSMVEKSKLDEDKEGKAVDPLHYRADGSFTKALGRDRIEFLINKLGMRSFTPETLKQLMDEVDETIDTTIEQQTAMDEALVPHAQRTMATTIDQQVALDEALVPSTKRLRIGRSNFRLPSDIQSKESTLQVEFWATAIVHHYSIRFKMNNKKHIINLETFRDMLHVCPRVPGQSFDELPFEAEILEFLRSLGHSDEIRHLTDVNVNKLFQPWRSFRAVINKCLTGKSSSFDSFRLSQAQLLWGLYHSRNVDYAFLIWEDFVYQIEHKKQKKALTIYSQLSKWYLGIKILNNME
nr:uncharacterized mitochondrial protein AtMg00810-like [Tanacetum cinerariifolium]